MKIERFYYDEAVKKWDAIEKECEAEYALLTETEKQLDKLQSEQESAEIIKKIEKQRAVQSRMIEYTRVKKFQEMIPGILRMAESSSMNILIEMKNLYQAHIRLSTGYISFMKEGPREQQEIVLGMIQEASDIDGCIEGKLMQFDFFYDFSFWVDR